MEEQRNPYEPTKAPLFADERPLPKSNADYEREYGGFWLRVAALLLDSLILLPVTLANVFGMLWSPTFVVYSFVPGMLITLFYWVYLVKRFGGTPGKRILKMRIATEDFSPVTTPAAIVRYAPLFVLSSLSSLGFVFAAQGIIEADYQSLDFADKLQALQQAAPPWRQWVGWVTQLWIVVTGIVMLCNSQRRALHDYIAGTVVLRERG